MQHSWLPIPSDSDFSVHNLPFGIFSDERPARAGLAIGEWIVDLSAAHSLNLFPAYPDAGSVFRRPVLNELMALGPTFSTYVRKTIQTELYDPASTLRRLAGHLLIKQSAAEMHLPIRIGNYTDFYSSEAHASGVGSIFRPENPLFPNWKQMPVAYHGRASSIVVSGTPVHRPWGQVAQAGGDPRFCPTHALDYELELGFVIGKSSEIGRPIPVTEAEDYVFGVVLFNDWSARDFQRWEYQPLGPFTSKNFASGMSPWIVTMDALQAFRIPAPEQVPSPLPYLDHPGRLNFDLSLSVGISAGEQGESTTGRAHAKHLYWTISQQIAHHTITGCNLQTGDLLATGTISGTGLDEKGCLLEATQNGKQPVRLANGADRRFLEDYDEVIMRGFAEKGGIRVGFGELRGQVLPTHRL